MSEELKPCPFCGGRAHILEVDLESSVRCASPRECRIAPATDWSVDENQLIEAWNTRKPEPDYKAMWKELKGAIESRIVLQDRNDETGAFIADEMNTCLGFMTALETAGPARKEKKNERSILPDGPRFGGLHLPRRDVNSKKP